MNWENSGFCHWKFIATDPAQPSYKTIPRGSVCKQLLGVECGGHWIPLKLHCGGSSHCFCHRPVLDHHHSLRGARGCVGFLEELGTKLADSHCYLLLVCQCYGLKQCSPDQRRQLLLPESASMAKCWKRKTNWKSLLLAFFSPPHHFPSLFCNVHKQCLLKSLWMAYHPSVSLRSSSPRIF